MFAKAVLAFLVLPGTAAFLVPLLLVGARRDAPNAALGQCRAGYWTHEGRGMQCSIFRS